MPVAALQVAYTSICLPACSKVTSTSGQSGNGEKGKSAKNSAPGRRRPGQGQKGLVNESIGRRIGVRSHPLRLSPFPHC